MAETFALNCDEKISMEKMYLENLEEWINDENKLVTYKWLSRMLSLHVNEAKHLLEKFVQVHDSSPESGTETSLFSVTYCLGGLVRRKEDDSCVFTIRLVRGTDRRKVEAEFVPPVSCHVYSVEKKVAQPEAHLLYGTELDSIIKSKILHANEYSGVTCAAAVLREREEVETPVVPPVVQPTVTVKSKEAATAKSTSADAAKSFFGNPKPKSSTTAPKGKPVNNSTNKIPDLQICRGDTLFKPQSDKSSKSVATSKTSGVLSEKNQSTADVNGNKPALKDGDSKNVENEKITKKSTIKPAQNDVGGDEMADDETKSKKRRRILDLSSSEDEEEASEEREDRDLYVPLPSSEDIEESMAVVEATDEKSNVVDVKPETDNNTTAAAATHYQSNRKLVSKTYVNDEGFIVTEKVWESQSTVVTPSDVGDVASTDAVADSKVVVVSDDVMEKKVVKPDQAASTAAAHKPAAKKSKKAAPPSNKQQTSMMSFFKKS